MRGNFQTFLDFIWRPENDGQPFHTTPGDPGGDTAWGVTFDTFVAWRLLQHRPRPLPRDLLHATQAELAAIYRVLFWNGVNGDALASGVDVAVANMGCGCGPKRAAELLQQVLGFAGDAVDGVVGPMTLDAAARWHAAELIEAYAARDEEYYASLPTWRLFGRGWDRRAEDCKALALRLAAA